jgi:hypothetical protein
MRKHDIHGTPAENLQRLITDCGVSPHKVGPGHTRLRARSLSLTLSLMC